MSPITAPLENATFNAPFKLVLAALAVRALERVATAIPINPQSPEKNPPLKNANGTNIIRYPLVYRKNKMQNTTAKNAPTTEYCLLIYAYEPSLTQAAISFISAVPSSCRIILIIRKIAKNIATKDPIGARNNIYPPLFISYLTNPTCPERSRGVK